jgi:prepilin-type N-terminal cleavage/methylation domain-containing protein
MAMANNFSALCSRAGFTLVELSLVLVIVGMLAGLGGAMVGPLTAFVKTRETRDLQDATLQSITSWGSSHNAIPDLAGFPGVAKSPNDAWGRSFSYLYDAELFAAAPTKDTICGRRSTPLTLVSSDPVATISNVAYVILSGAGNATLSATLNGSWNGTPINGIISGSGAATGTLSVPGPNGNLVRWVTLDELRAKVGCQGAPLRIVNNELPAGAVATPYTVTLVADGGVPLAANPATFKWCVTILPAGFTQTGGVQNASCLGLPESSWAAASSGLTISFAGNAAATGAYPITVVARDNADSLATSAACNSSEPGDNCAQKLYVLTVNP